MNSLDSRLEHGLTRHVAALLTSVAALALVTGAIFALDSVAPVLSLGVLYVFAVLAVAVLFGLAYAIPVSIASMLAFNWFFLPPKHTFTLQDSENWVALAVYLFTAVVVSVLAARARRRAQESALLAEIAASLLEREQVRSELDRIAEEAARALQVESARIELGGRSAARVTTVTRSRRATGGWAPSTSSGHGPEARRADGTFSRHSHRCSGSRSTASAWPARPSKPKRCAEATR